MTSDNIKDTTTQDAPAKAVFRSEPEVSLVDFMGSDARVVQSARVSTLGSGALDSHGTGRFIDYLLRNRHGVPFESSVFTFLIKCPVFVSRQLVKHRISSISEVSGRYTELDGVFYMPGRDRPIVQTGKPGDYTFAAGTDEQRALVSRELRYQAEDGWGAYNSLLDQGVAREIARMVLPVSVYTAMMMTVNVRSLMNLLALRVKSSASAVPSHPQFEVDQVAQLMEEIFADHMPLTHAAFVRNLRVAP